jgi:hypothetical protein
MVRSFLDLVVVAVEVGLRGSPPRPSLAQRLFVPSRVQPWTADSVNLMVRIVARKRSLVGALRKVVEENWL